MKIAGCVLAVCLSLGFFGYAAAEERAKEAKVELKQVALFKNGLGFFVYEVIVPDKAKSFYVIPEAAASHGTFWVSYPPKVDVESIVASEPEAVEQVEAATMAELLRANVGRKVRIYPSSTAKEEVFIEGKLIKVTQEEKKEPPNPYTPGRGTDYGPRNEYYGVRNMALLNTSEGEVALNVDSILRINFLEKEPAATYEKKKTGAVRLGISLKKPAGGQKIVVSFLAKGVSWMPSYMVDITEPNNARLAAKAEVMDEVCDLNGVEVKLITGFPNLQFADVASPIAMKENLAQFLQALIRGQSEREMRARRGDLSNVMVQSAIGGAEAFDYASVMPGYGAAEVGKIAEDLFLYPLENVKLAKGAVGYFPLFTETLDYRHIYRWEIPDYVRPEGDYYDQSRQQQGPPQQEVWHCIRLQNSTNQPWTTAPAEIIKDGVILGQDTLNYTPVKEKGTIRITRAVNVKAEQIELETKRERGVAQFYGYQWDLVTVEGKLSATNLQDKAIALEVTKSLSGEVKSMQPEAKLEKLAKALRAVNANNRLTWTIELGPGEQKDIAYTYEIYVRR